MLEIKNLNKTYPGGKKALTDVNISINDGEIFGFIGHNGAGKTTTIKSIVGILTYDSGTIEINGMNIKDKSMECKQITAYIPDNPDLYEMLTGMQYLNFISDVYKIDKKIRSELIKKYSDMFELTNNLGDVISSYSHGMKQKLALISALIRNPKLLVLDEPFVGLDPKAAYLVKETMKELCKKGTSIFFSTHVLEVAEKLCDRIAIIKEILFIGILNFHYVGYAQRAPFIPFRIHRIEYGEHVFRPFYIQPTFIHQIV